MVQISRRIRAYWTKWRTITTIYGDMCFYCRNDAAVALDHVLPYSYTNNDDLDNLRPCCGLCNSLAGDKIFASIDEKRWFLMARHEKRKKTRHHSCSECGVPFIYREQSISLFLCPECYDIEYGTSYADSTTWRNWLELLDTAGTNIEIYRDARKLYKSMGMKGRKYLTTCIIEAVRRMEAYYLADTPEYISAVIN